MMLSRQGQLEIARRFNAGTKGNSHESRRDGWTRAIWDFDGYPEFTEPQIGW
jgi:hypothetical protein